MNQIDKKFAYKQYKIEKTFITNVFFNLKKPTDSIGLHTKDKLGQQLPNSF